MGLVGMVPFLPSKWGQKAAEPSPKIVIDTKDLKGFLKSRGLAVDRIEPIPYSGFVTVRYVDGGGNVLHEKQIPVDVQSLATLWFVDPKSEEWRRLSR